MKKAKEQQGTNCTFFAKQPKETKEVLGDRAPHEVVSTYISHWLKDYCKTSGAKGFIIGISGGIDSALTSTLCAMTGFKLHCVELNIHQNPEEVSRAQEHIAWLKKNFSNVTSGSMDLTSTFELLKTTLPNDTAANALAMANTRSRLRMTTLYAVGQSLGLLVAGTGNKIEDFGVGFFTKYGDGGVDLNPIGDLTKSEVYRLSFQLDIVESIQTAAPTDGLWDDDRTDEGQLKATYKELEWAMRTSTEGCLAEGKLTVRQKQVLDIYHDFHSKNAHKMKDIPVCHLDDISSAVSKLTKDEEQQPLEAGKHSYFTV